MNKIPKQKHNASKLQVYSQPQYSATLFSPQSVAVNRNTLLTGHFCSHTFTSTDSGWRYTLLYFTYKTVPKHHRKHTDAYFAIVHAMQCSILLII
jgi:hypothetical protein